MNTMLDRELNKRLLYLSQDERDWFEERAAILQFEAGMPRDDAEQMAFRLTVTEFGLKALLEE